MDTTLQNHLNESCCASGARPDIYLQSLEYDEATNSIIATLTDSTTVSVELPTDVLTSISDFSVSGNTVTLKYIDELGDENTKNVTLPIEPDVLTSISDFSVDGNTVTLKYIDELGDENTKTVTLPIEPDVLTSISDFSVLGNVVTLKYIDELGNENIKSITLPIQPQVVTTVNNTVTGHKIAEYTNEENTVVAINETITVLGQPTYDGTNLSIPYTDETGTLVTKIVSLANTSGISVYFDSTDPATATIFDTENPPVTNNDALKEVSTNTYYGSDGSVWSWNGTAYVTKTYSFPVPQRDVATATVAQTSFTLAKIPIGGTEKVFVTRNGVDISRAFTWSGAIGTYNSVDNYNAVIDANDLLQFHYSAY